MRDEQIGRGVRERVWFGAVWLRLGNSGWFLAQGWTVAELELYVVSIEVVIDVWGLMVPGSPRSGLWRGALGRR